VLLEVDPERDRADEPLIVSTTGMTLRALTFGSCGSKVAAGEVINITVN
jgi:hypothetical protein